MIFEMDKMILKSMWKNKCSRTTKKITKRKENMREFALPDMGKFINVP